MPPAAGSALFPAAWLGLFLGLRRPDLGFYGLVAMCLMVPYLAWVSFAGVLNWTLWQMNGARPA